MMLAQLLDLGCRAIPAGVALRALFHHSRGRDATTRVSLLLPFALLPLAAAAQPERVVVTWTNATGATDCSPLPAWDSAEPGRLAATIIEHGELVGSAFTRVGETRVAMPATSAEFSPVVTQQFAVRARHVTAAGAPSGNTLAVRIGDQPTPEVPCTPPVVTPPPPETPDPPPARASSVTSTRIEAAEWTCRDASGAVLSSHARADKAQEACTNRALASPGAIFEIRPSGYRIVAD